MTKGDFMEQKYSWKQMPDIYHASYYNDRDAEARRIFVVIDNENDKNYLFPRRYTKKTQNGIRLIEKEIDDDLWNQKFFNWSCSTSPDLCVNIPKEFLTPELIEICLNNSSYPEFLQEVPNLTRYQCEKFVKRLPQAAIYLPEDYKYEKWAKEVLNEFPELLIYFPLDSVDDTTRSCCYAKVSFENKILFIAKGYMDDKMIGTLLSSQTLMYLIEECLFLKQSLLETIPWNKIPEYLFTEEICLKLIANDVACVSIIPKKFYGIAVKNNSLALNFISDKDKTYEMCLDAVTFYPPLINKVPVNILNSKFFSDLQTKRVSISQKSMAYINECLRLNEQFHGIINSNQEDELEMAYNEIPSEIRNISINNLSIFFSSPSLEQITKLGITNLGELFVQSKTVEFIDYFKHLEIFNEVINTTGLLRCKYLNEKPLIAINEEKFNGNDEYNFYKRFGLSKRCVTALSRKNFCNSSKEFFLKMQSHNIENELMKARNLGERGKNEIIAKASIVINYYQLNEKNIINSEHDSNNNEDLKELYKELGELRQASKEIDEKTDIVLAKIQEKLLNKPEGGAQLLQLNPKKP